MQSERGFTLLEVLIALAIFALTASTLITNTTRQVIQANQLENRTIAHWVAQNELNQIQLTEASDGDSAVDRLPKTGASFREVRLADRDWQLRISVVTTENKDIHRITVEVFGRQDDLDESPVASLSSFVGRY